MAESTRVTSTDTAGWRPLAESGRQVVDAAPQLLSVVRTRIGSESATLFARPIRQSNADVIDWYVPWSGTVVSLDSLSRAEAERHRESVNQQLERVGEFAATLQAGGGQAALLGTLLAMAARPVKLTQIYLVNDRPVIVLWGFEEIPSATPVEPRPAILPAKSPAATTALDSANTHENTERDPLPITQVATSVEGADYNTRTRAGWWRWLLLLLLAFTLAYLISRALKPLAPIVQEKEVPAPSAIDEIRALTADKSALIDEYIGLNEARLTLLDQCHVEIAEPVEPEPEAVAALPPADPEPQPPPDTTPMPAPEPEQEPFKEFLEQEAPAVEPPSEVTVPEVAEVSANRQKPTCATRKKYEAPEVMLVVDASGSMRDPIAGARNRMEASKSSISSMVSRLPEDVDVGLIEFSDCSTVLADKFYKYTERRTLLGRVNGLTPRRGTPLAYAIERAGRRTSRSAPGVIVVVSDGEDSCQGDACATARAIATEKPNITINVIDISGAGANPTAQCIASPSGGTVYRPNSSGDMANKLQDATGEPDASECK